MKKLLHPLALAILIIITLFAIPLALNPTFADEIDDLQKQIDQLNLARQQSINATKPLIGQLDSLKRQLAQVQHNLDIVSANIQSKQQELDLRKEKLIELTAIFNDRVVQDYENGYLYGPFGYIFGSQKLADKLYHLKTINENRGVIKTISSEILSVLTDKEKLEKDEVRLAAVQADVDKNAKFLNGEITKAQKYQTELATQIAQLSAQQQALIAAKLASLNIPKSAYAGIGGGCVDDRGVDPGFSPRFALFTYGVPNRVGLNQYGAKGRAEAGQGYQQILGSYYNYDSIGSVGNPNIHVAGTNNYGQSIDQTLSVEDYLKHIYEMPASWHPEALKAQVLAARSYVLAATNNGQSSICSSDSCQEFKVEQNSQSWIDAVNATSGQVMIKGGSPIKAWFSSTHGGYIFSSGEIGWSGTDWTKHGVDTSSGSVGSFSELQSTAYDRSSPWFYCDWGARSAYNKTAWLKPDELADIVNVEMLGKADSSTQTHLSQQDRPNPDGTDTWDAGRVRQELQSRGIKPFGGVSGVSIDWDKGAGRVNSVSVSGDGGSVSVNGTDFKNFFNLRAPANIQIVGPLYNVEQQ